jgi:hypothetical protein
VETYRSASESNIICGTIGGFSQFTIQEPTIICPSDPVSVEAGTVNCSYSLYYPASITTANWNWGDGETDPGVIGGDPLQITGSYTYLAPGVYTVQLDVTEDSTLWSDNYRYVVVYDPLGGFVTGGGWIHSPTDAYVLEPTLSGKATFGFVSKYKKGTNVPVGNTEFQFHAANFSFRSTEYDWLVIAGARAMFKGTGVIDGAGNYGFMLTAIDGALPGGGGEDKFRIKIWDLATDAMVYDNQMDASDDADLTTVIGGGSIVIHKGKK